ncbi:MAG: hypothetical protein IJV04_05130 [Lachnospiraceae bacterium]|nr:hypothetical protein [Lachnospiraceae bacterium]
MRRNICCLTVILFLAALFYSPLPVRAAKQANYSLGHQAAVLYNNESGLPTSEANAIAQTSDGFIWIGGIAVSPATMVSVLRTSTPWRLCPAQ